MNLMRNKVSILIPVYNREKYIGSCIESAINQNYEDFEIIVSDNSSTDSTWAICQKYAAQDERVRILRNEVNIGPVQNWIRCTKEARGEFSKILFSDDLLEPDCISRMRSLLSNSNVGLVSCSARVGSSKNNSYIAYKINRRSPLKSAEYLALLLESRVAISPGAALLRTEDLVRNLHADFPTAIRRPFGRHGAGPDIILLLLTVRSYPFVEHIDESLVFFRAHAESFSVANVDNEVTDGYVSAISLFLRKNQSWHQWLSYVTRTWVAKCRQGGIWISPIAYLKSHEGRGSIAELGFGALIILWLIARRLSQWVPSR